jgi:superfamily II DNA or RNA helicase
MEQINKYQKDILKKYKKYRLSTKKSSFKQICFPKNYTPQIQQLFVSKFINPNTNNKNILLYHKIGAGKTCAAIKIAEEWKEKRDIIFVCPASLIGGFYKELRSECTNTTYVSDIEREQLNTLDVLSTEYKKLIKTINNRIDEYYQVYSYNKFIDLLNKKKIKLNNTLLIIDEVQNIVSETGSYYKTIYKAIMNAPLDLRIVIMTATPIFDKPMELGLTLNLLRPKKLFPIGNDFNEEYIDYKVIDNKAYYDIKNIKDLQIRLNGLVSYYPGAASYVFPTRIQKIIKCPMSKYQYECYKVVQEREGEINKLDLLKLPNNFFIGSRIISNIAFPNKLVNQLGLNALTPRLMNLDNLKTYSTKFYYIMKKILKTSGTVFLYSNFKEYGGILTFIKILEHYKFKNFHKEGTGKNRYAIWSGDETLEQKEKLRNVFNNKLNVNGSKIKIVLGSPAIKEGVNLLRVRQVHILEPYWNISRLEQVIGRAVRFCSHKDVDLEKRYVKVYIYIATIPTELNKTEMLKHKEDRIITVDEHIYNMALTKQKLSEKFEDVIKRTAIDYNLFQNIKN